MNDLVATPIVASYRIQLTPTFGFAETIGVLDHLSSLGVSHLYVSPIAEAMPGSMHGYDVIDHTRVRTEFGGEAGLFELLDAAAERRLGVVIDHVPNHMAVAEAHLNDRWWETLRDGPESPASIWFDIDWAGGDGRVIVPKLGDRLSDVLAAGGLEIGDGDRGPELRYGPLRFPLAPGTERLHLVEALDRQHYRLAWWQDPQRNVRRFFTIDDLVAVRAEDQAVADTIDTIPTLLRDHPAFAGVRVDHVDGLAQPEAYLARLRARIGGHRWLLVEKILAVDETLPASWPVDGTTGYEHIRAAEHALLDPDAEQPLTDLWTELTGDDRPFAIVEDEARREALGGGLQPDLDRLVRQLAAVDTSDSERVRSAVIELTIGVHRYRTYLPDDPASAVELEAALERAGTSRPDLRDDLARLVDLILDHPGIATRWEQLCSPVMAKGAEDRAFYRYLRLASLCEVGGAPGRWTTSVDEFHRYQRQVQDLMPTTMLAGTTHDTKRSEGVRARSLALAEIASRWVEAVRSWIRGHEGLITESGLDAATASLALQTAVTAWPIDAGRLTDYLVKSSREADAHTSWTEPDAAYEAALAALATTLEHELADDEQLAGAPTGLADIITTTLRPGWAASLTTLAIRLTAPGVPDLYQGTAAFTYSLVDPDNRIEPDWDERRALVDEAALLDGPSAWAGHDVEAAKAVVITRTLAMRRRHLSAFGAGGGYLDLTVTGEHAGDVIAFARTDGGVAVAITVVATRFTRGHSWSQTFVDLPRGTWTDVLDDDSDTIGGSCAVPLGGLDRFPVVVLEASAVSDARL